MRVSHLLDAGALRIATPIFIGAFAADLVSKRWAVAHANALIFKDTPSYLPLRVLMSRSRSASSSHGWRRCADSVGSGGCRSGAPCSSQGYSRTASRRCSGLEVSRTSSSSAAAGSEPRRLRDRHWPHRRAPLCHLECRRRLHTRENRATAFLKTRALRRLRVRRRADCVAPSVSPKRKSSRRSDPIWLGEGGPAWTRTRDQRIMSRVAGSDSTNCGEDFSGFLHLDRLAV
jgi:hypothetical protein